MKYYQATITHTRQCEDGLLKRVSSNYLVDALSFTEAESNVYSWAEVNITGEFVVKNIRATKITEICNPEDSDLFWLVKTKFQTVDGDRDKMVTVNYSYIVGSEDMETAIALVRELTSQYLVDVQIIEAKLTNIEELILPEPKNEKA